MPSLKKNLIINISYQLFVVLVPLIVAPYVTRTIGPNGVGIYSYTFSVASCFALLGMLGIANYGNRAIASEISDRQSRGRIFWSIWPLQVGCTAVACVLYLVYCLLFVNENKLIAFVQIITVLCSAFDISWFFFGIEKFQVTVLRNLVVKLLNMSLIFLLVNDEGDLLLYVLIMVTGLLLNNLLLFFFLKKEIVYVRPSFDLIRSHIKPIIILFAPVIAISIYKLMDKVMIGFLSSTVENGYYEYAEKIISLPGTVITAIGTVMLPRLSNLIGRNDKKQASRLIQISIEVMMFLTIGMASGVFCVGRDFAPFFFGDDFSASGLIMMALAPSVVFQGWANVIRTEYLIPEKKDTIYVKSAWLGAVTNLVVNLSLIPSCGAIGAAIGTVIAEAAVAIYQSVQAGKELPIMRYFRNVLFYFVPAVTMWFGVSGIRTLFSENSIVKIIAEVGVAVLIYGAMCLPYLIMRYRRIKGEYE